MLSIIYAVVTALGLAGAVIMESVMTTQEAKAAGPGFPGCANTIGFNASKGRCNFH
jgi:hypothetical protein